MKNGPHYYLLILFSGAFFLLTSCKPTGKIAEESQAPAYPIHAVDIRQVKMEDQFWLPIIKRVQEKTISYAINKCIEEGRLENFLIAGGKMDGTVRGQMPFDDTDIYKIIEGASNSLISAPNPELEAQLDSMISIIAVGQEEDGYLTTWRTINPAKPPAPWVQVKEPERWDGLFMSHELYNAGHLYEAAYTHHLATGKRNFLEIALKNADLMAATFGEGEGKIAAVPGHQIIETGLIKLYRLTGKKEYLELSKYFLDNRGNPENHELFGPYSQDHIPVVAQEEVVGHAVRAMYMYAAMTDIAVLMEDSAYEQAVNSLWDNMVSKKMYITGGIGARHEGEAFGDNYELPNLTAYNETCAAIGSVYWNHRLHSKTGEAKYFDLIEKTLYNGLISGLSLDGIHFFYPNALEADGTYKFNRGSCTRQGWFDCSCCPTNMIRFIPSVPALIYSQAEEEIFVNLYASNSAKIDVQGHSFALTQKTDYPWNGRVEVSIEPEKASLASIKFRLPSWARGIPLPGGLYSYASETSPPASIAVNGELLEIDPVDGYFTLKRKWKSGDKVLLEFPMPVRRVRTSEKVEENREKLALERGPLLYALEEMDNPNTINDIQISPNDTFSISKKDILGGIYVLHNQDLTAIPYYAWSNRGVGIMKVWHKETP